MRTRSLIGAAGLLLAAGVLASTAAVLAAGTSTSTLVLDISRVTQGPTVFTNVLTNPGDQFTLRFTNTGASALTIDPSRTTIAYTSGQNRESLFKVSGGQSSAQ